MAHTTTCPACGTSFRVTAEQLLAKDGQVRCGRCAKVFNAYDALNLDYPSPAPPPTPEPRPPAPPPPVETPVRPPLAPVAAPVPAAPPVQVEAPTPSPPPEETPLATLPPSIPTAAQISVPVFAEEVEPAPVKPTSPTEMEPLFEPAAEPVSVEEPLADSLVIEEFILPPSAPPVAAPAAKPAPAPAVTRVVAQPAPVTVVSPAPPENPASPEPDPELDRLAAQLHAEALAALAAHAEPPPVVAPPVEPLSAGLDDGEPPPEVLPTSEKRPLPVWLTGFGAVVMLALLVLQSALFFRTDILAYSPASRPMLETLCEWAGCRIALPRNPDLLSIETSALEAEPGRAGLVALNAVLRNRAGYAQHYPQFELTLTDYQDKLIARRIFQPQEYLPPGAVLSNGMPANEEIDVKLHLDLGELQAAGYRVYLFYSATTS